VHRLTKLGFIRALNIGLIAGLSGAFASPVSAGNRTGKNADREAARQDLMYVLEAYREILETYDIDPALAAALRDAGEDVAALSDEGLSMAASLAPLYSEMRRNLELLQTYLADRPQVKMPAGHARSGGFPDAAYPDVDPIELVIGVSLDDLDAAVRRHFDWVIALLPGWVENLFPPPHIVPIICEGDPDGDGLPNRATDEVLMIADNLLSLSQLRLDVAGRICDQDLTILGEGGNLSVVCIVGDIVHAVAKRVHDSLFLCEDLIDSAEIAASYLRLGHLHDDVVDVAGKIDLVTEKVVVIQETLDTKIELRRIRLQITELKEKRRFLLAAEEGGQPVDVTLIRVMASAAGLNSGNGQDDTPITFTEVPAVATSTGTTGLFDVALDLPHDLRNAKIFRFEVKDEHSDAAGNFSHEHFGTIVFHRTEIGG